MIEGFFISVKAHTHISILMEDGDPLTIKAIRRFLEEIAAYEQTHSIYTVGIMVDCDEPKHRLCYETA